MKRRPCFFQHAASHLIRLRCPNHVARTCCGNNRRTLFSYSTDYKKFIDFLEKALELQGCSMHAMTLMRNHVHLLVTPTGMEDLSRFVKAFAQRYALYRNRRRGGSGKLFQQRYTSKPVLDERYLATVQVYIEINAWRAGTVAEPRDHHWSTFSIHAGHPELSKIPLRLWTPSPWYLGLGDDSLARAERYLELVDQICLEQAGDSWDNRTEAIDIRQDGFRAPRLEGPDRTRAS